MKKFVVIPGGRMFQDVVDGPGWTDIEVDGYYDTNGKYVQPKYRSSSNVIEYDKLSNQGNTKTLERCS